MPTAPGVAAVRASGQTERFVAELDLAKAALGDFKDLLIEFVRTASSNPLTGFALVVIVADILKTQKVISPSAASLIEVTATAAYGVDIALDLESGLLSIFGKNPGTSNADLVRPSVETMVAPPTTAHGNGQGAGSGSAISRLLGLVAPGAGAGGSSVSIPAGAYGEAAEVPPVA